MVKISCEKCISKFKELKGSYYFLPVDNDSHIMIETSNKLNLLIKTNYNIKLKSNNHVTIIIVSLV